MINKTTLYCGFLLLVFLKVSDVYCQTTGKIAGIVTEKETGEFLPGSNIMITAKWVGETEVEMSGKFGAAVGEDGTYFIINVPPGFYTVMFQMIGYENLIVKEVQVSVNRTTYLNGALKQSTIEGEVIVVTADKITIKKDQTSSIRNISSREIEILPVQSVEEVVEMQPGVVQGHFRGGRSSEVSYLIDGLQVNESFFHTGQTVTVEIEAVEELEVITGTFNAEYGQAMSGVVNAVTKEGGNRFHASFSANFGNYYTSHKDIFIGLKDTQIDRNQDYRLFVSGPIFSGKLFFVSNVRFRDYTNHLNGIHRFNVHDYSDFTSYDSTEWYTENTGDNYYVPLNWHKSLSFFSKLTYNPFNSLRTSLIYTLNNDESKSYNHSYKYNPYGIPSQHKETKMIKFHLNHNLSRSAFYEFQTSYVENYYGNYVFKNPYDSRYVHEGYSRSQGPGFLTGGQSKGHTTRYLRDINIKFDLSWQIYKSHLIKIGILFIKHDLNNRQASIVNKYRGTEEENIYYIDPETGQYTFLYYEPEILPDYTTYSDIYKAQPYEFSWYIQDKMEFDEMVMNLGLRFESFDPNTVYPSQLRNPANQLAYPNNPEKMSTYPQAEIKYQFSPRIGLSYQLGSKALLRFSYGHFMQMPPLYSIYQNHSFLIPPSDFSVTLGNPKLMAQKTVQYEVGLWQKLTEDMNLEVAVFYRDIYDLLSARIITTFNQIKYGLFSNKDYGNVRGLEIKYEYLYNHFIAILNYTYQYTRGNADNPTFSFTRAGNSQDPVNRMIPMSWDQRHTFNISVGYNTTKYGATTTIYYNSGTTYTWDPLDQSTLSRINLFPNNAHKPEQISVDLNAYYNILTFNGINLRLTILVYNLLDRLNDVNVNNQTGTAYSAIVRDIHLSSHRSDFNNYYDIIHNPSMYSEPRKIIAGIEIIY